MFECCSSLSERENFEHLITVVVDHLYRDLARLGLLERSAPRAVKARPRGLVDLRP